MTEGATKELSVSTLLNYLKRRRKLDDETLVTSVFNGDNIYDIYSNPDEYRQYYGYSLHYIYEVVRTDIFYSHHLRHLAKEERYKYVKNAIVTGIEMKQGGIWSLNTKELVPIRNYNQELTEEDYLYFYKFMEFYVQDIIKRMLQIIEESAVESRNEYVNKLSLRMSHYVIILGATCGHLKYSKEISQEDLADDYNKIRHSRVNVPIGVIGIGGRLKLLKAIREGVDKLIATTDRLDSYVLGSQSIRELLIITDEYIKECEKEEGKQIDINEFFNK